MSSMQFFSARQATLACAGLAVTLALSGCSLLHSQPRTAAVAPAEAPAVVQAQEAPAVQAPQTDTEAAIAQAADEAADTADQATTTVLADAGPALKASAPRDYVVKRGDTLWGIANMFLRNPWEWPEIWYVNPTVRNPHRIYPGDTLHLALATNGHTVLQLVRGPVGLAAVTRIEPLLRSSALETPIEAIPYSVLATYLSHPTVLTLEQIRAAPYIVGLPQNHDLAGTGSEVFVKQLSGARGEHYIVLHVDQPLINPDNGHRLGYLAIYTGTAEVTRPGRISEAVITDSARETQPGDVLIPEEHETVTDFVPHIPARPVSGRIMAVADLSHSWSRDSELLRLNGLVQLGTLVVGPTQIVAINRGSSDGLERGNVLTVDQEMGQVPDPCANIDYHSTCTLHPSVTLPTDVAGTLLVFRTFPHVSYALILGDTVPMVVGNRVHSP